jgi:hypothetical protein
MDGRGKWEGFEVAWKGTGEGFVGMWRKEEYGEL